MVIANFMAGNRLVPAWLKHAPDTGLTVVDLIAPFFVIAIGLTIVASTRARADRDGRLSAVRHVVIRYLAILGIGAIISGGEQLVGVSDEAYVWGVLQSIGVAGLLMVPVLFAPTSIRLAYGAVLLIAFQLGSAAGWSEIVFAWSHGGLPGSISWAAMLAFATVFPDIGRRHRLMVPAVSLLYLGAGAALALVVAISKNRVSASYVLVSTGAGGLLYTLFLLTQRVRAKGQGILVWWGRNPLLLYLTHYLLLALVVLPNSRSWYVEAPAWLLLLQGVVLIGILTGVAWFLSRRELVIKL